MDKKRAESDALSEIIGALEPFEPEVRARLMRTASTFFGLPAAGNTGSVADEAAPSLQTRTHATFSGDRSISPKEFLLEKQPKSDVERVACLAFHYRKEPLRKN